MLRARANGETFVSATMCRQQFVLVCLTSQIAAPTSPRATPRAFEFLEIFCSNSLLPGLKSCSNAPTLGKITRLLFKLFRSFYDASEAVYV